MVVVTIIRWGSKPTFNRGGHIAPSCTETGGFPSDFLDYYTIIPPQNNQKSLAHTGTILGGQGFQQLWSYPNSGINKQRDEPMKDELTGRLHVLC